MQTNTNGLLSCWERESVHVCACKADCFNIDYLELFNSIFLFVGEYSHFFVCRISWICRFVILFQALDLSTKTSTSVLSTSKSQWFIWLKIWFMFPLCNIWLQRVSFVMTWRFKCPWRPILAIDLLRPLSLQIYFIALALSLDKFYH